MALNDIPITPPPDNRTQLDTSQSMRPDIAKEIQSVWSKVVEEHGPPEYPGDRPEEPEAEAATEVEAKPEPAAEPKKAAAKKEPEPEATPEPEPEVEATPEEPKGDRTRALRDLVAERKNIRLREQHREAQRQAEHQARMAEVQSAQSKYGPLMKVAEAIEAGDFDAIAAGLGEFLGNDELKSWEKLNSTALQAMQSPLYRQQRELKRQIDLQKKQAEDYQNRNAQQAEAQRRAAMEHEWKRGIAAELANDDDPAISALIEARPQIADMVYSEQARHYHATGGETLTARDALSKISESIFSDFRWWENFINERSDSPLVKRLAGDRGALKKPENGDQSTAKTEHGDRKTATSERRGEPKGPPKNVSHTRAAAASATTPMSKDALIKKFAREMEQAPPPK